METSQYSAPIPRGVRLVLGIVATLIGAALLSFGGLGVYRLFERPPETSVTIILCIVVAVGLALFVAGLRLVTGTRRRDGGLFSPWALRFGGMFFLIAPVILFVARRSLFSVLEAGASISTGIACFVIANRREQHDR
jgi:hypothetical protein